MAFSAYLYVLLLQSGLSKFFGFLPSSLIPSTNIPVRFLAPSETILKDYRL